MAAPLRFLLLLLLPAAAAATEVTAEMTPDSCKTRSHCDISGDNVTSPAGGGTVTTCCALCASTQGCHAAVWSKPYHTCFLKASSAGVHTVKIGAMCMFPSTEPPPPPMPPPPVPPGGLTYNCEQPPDPWPLLPRRWLLRTRIHTLSEPKAANASQATS
jgi:hypothetical protein